MFHVARVESPGRLEEQHMDLLVGDRAVLDASGHDQKLALLELDLSVPKLHAESPFEHQE